MMSFRYLFAPEVPKVPTRFLNFRGRFIGLFSYFKNLKNLKNLFSIYYMRARIRTRTCAHT